MQFEDLSDNAKKAIEQFRICDKSGLTDRYKKLECSVLLRCAIILNNVKDWELTTEFVESKNYWLKDK